MIQKNMHEAKSQLSKLVERALKGEQVVIAKAGKPAVKLVPCTEAEELPPRVPGGYEGQIWMADDFDETPQELIDLFEGNYEEE